MRAGKTKRVFIFLMTLVVLLGVVGGVVAGYSVSRGGFPAELYPEGMAHPVDILEGEVPLGETVAGGAPASSGWTPTASGAVVYSGGGAEIDASNMTDGYVMIRYTGSSKARLKVIITGPVRGKYTYNLRGDGNYEVFPLSDGSGNYQIAVYQNTSGTKYVNLHSKAVSVKLTDEFAPFLRPNQYVNYTEKSQVLTKAAELTKKCKTDLEKVEVIYTYVVENFVYDKKLAATVKSGYLPNVDAVLKAKKGICFDYAAVMTAMLRSQGVPTKLVVGYTGSIYHAWINTYTPETGWVEGVVFFDGKTWKLMDPTFASSSKSSDKIMDYIGDGKNYSEKYLY